MNYSRLMQSLKHHEGYRKMPYKDSKGYWTVGFGHLIHHSDFMGCETAGDYLDRITSSAQHDLWLETDIANATTLAVDWLGESLWSSLIDDRQEIMVEMFYQMGNGARFKKMRAALEAEDFTLAAHEMLDSKWAKEDTPGRAGDLATRMQLAGS